LLLPSSVHRDFRLDRTRPGLPGPDVPTCAYMPPPWKPRRSQTIAGPRAEPECHGSVLFLCRRRRARASCSPPCMLRRLVCRLRRAGPRLRARPHRARGGMATVCPADCPPMTRIPLARRSRQATGRDRIIVKEMGRVLASLLSCGLGRHGMGRRERAAWRRQASLKGVRRAASQPLSTD
jgi:hypothetical protein